MNIFKILSSGDKKITEPHISAFMGYLLDPNQDHGMGAIFLTQILNHHIQQNEDNPHLKDLVSNERIKNLSDRSIYSVDVFLEQAFKNTIDKLNLENKLIETGEDEESSEDVSKIAIQNLENQDVVKKEIVDIMIFIYELKKPKEDAAVNTLTKSKILKQIILIEIKTQDGSANRPEQISLQVKNSKQVLRDLKENGSVIVEFPQEAIENISMIYITPKGAKSDNSVLSFKNSELNNHPFSHIYWSEAHASTPDKSEINFSIEKTLNDIINNNFDVKNEIIPEYTKLTLQSFSNFIYTDFQALMKQKPGGNNKDFFYGNDALVKLEKEISPDSYKIAKEVHKIINGRLSSRTKKEAAQKRISYFKEENDVVHLILIFLRNEGVRVQLNKIHLPKDFNSQEWQNGQDSDKWKEIIITTKSLEKLEHLIDLTIKNVINS